MLDTPETRACHTDVVRWVVTPGPGEVRMTLESLIEQARSAAEQRAFLYDHDDSYRGGIEEILRALAQASSEDIQASA